ncbi:MAG: type II toxin-antitoxin system RelE/ParE family toxin [Mucilaginibacter sp.]
MKYTHLLLRKAQTEILDAWEWYEDKQDGLGDRFKQEVEKKIKSILKNPLKYPLKGKYREAQTEVFPFLIVYDIDEITNVIFILSVFHMSRHPKKKH